MRIWIVFIAFSTLCTQYAQNISNLELIDNYSRPLISNDDGFEFGYFCYERGRVEGYLEFSSFDINIFHNKIDYYGKTSVRIQNRQVIESITEQFIKNGFFDLRVIHYSIQSKKRSESLLALRAFIKAPYGTELIEPPLKPTHLLNIPPSKPTHLLLDPPEYPTLFPTNLKKYVADGVGIFGLISGLSIGIGGALWKDKIKKDPNYDKKN